MKILFGVFDWGLGHATRDTPLIRALLAAGHRVDLLSTGRALRILRQRFGDNCRLFDVPSLRSPYVETKHFVLNFTATVPLMLHSLIRARRISEQIIRRERYDLVISDCRYDVYDEPANSIFINHQLRFHSYPIGEQMIERWLTAQMNHYRVVAVPDYGGTGFQPVVGTGMQNRQVENLSHNDLSGRLSHNLRYFDRRKIRYIGILSHLRKLEIERDVDYFISVSGPEPQRTKLEEIVLGQAERLPGKVVIALGNPDHAAVQSRGHVEVYSYFDQARQQEMTNRARMMISRSGYTTIMEEAEIEVPRSLTIPTPGQTEQEYLSRYYDEHGKAPWVSQYDLQLDRDVARAENYTGFRVPWRTEQSVRNFMALI